MGGVGEAVMARQPLITGEQRKVLSQLWTYRPEVVDENVENAQNDDKHHATELRFESNHDHDAGDQAEQANDHPPEGPCPGEDKADEEKNQQHSSTKLEVHFPVLLIERGKTRRCKSFPDPAVG